MNPINSPSLHRALLGIAGAAAGGLVGFFVFAWIVRQGLYALVLPGAALGLGAGLGAGHNSHVVAAGYGILGLLLTLFCEWRVAPFVIDESLGYFATHLHQLKPTTLLLTVLAGYVTYRLALGFGSKRPQRGDGSLDSR